jgi:hypothetical protein
MEVYKLGWCFNLVDEGKLLLIWFDFSYSISELKKDARIDPWTLSDILPRDGNQFQVQQPTPKVLVAVLTVISVLILQMSQ